MVCSLILLNVQLSDWQRRLGASQMCFTRVRISAWPEVKTIAEQIHEVPYRSDWLYDIGLGFVFLNIVLFVTNCVMIGLRFRLNRGSFQASFGNQRECLFVPASVSHPYSLIRI